MHKGKFVSPLLFVLTLAAANAAMAQQKNPQPPITPNQSSLRQQQESAVRASAAAARGWEHGYDLRATTEKINLPRVKAHLVIAWQQLGLSPKDAQTVASALRVSDANGAKAPSLISKSDEQIASMMQTALVSKNYILANQLMINYERKKVLVDGTSVSRGDN